MSDKILKLDQAQTLYQDLRGRIDALPTSSDIPEVPVQDVQVNGTSILQDGMANVPVAGSGVLGVVAVAAATEYHGIAKGTGSTIMIRPAIASDIKSAATGNQRPIVPSHQHESTFYGLAKAAGADMKDIANTTVGTYPDAQKAAIQNMLGITDLISTEETTTATAAHALNSTFMMNGKLHRATTAIAIGDAVEVGTNCEVVKADEVFVKNTDYASGSTWGLVKTKLAGGTNIDSVDHTLIISCATSSWIKAGTNLYAPIVPSNQHASVFYGLSKLAGVDLANETVTVGTYPETSKTAIRSLIGAAATSDIPSVPVQDVQVDSASVVTNGVADIPTANNNTFGVVKGYPDQGVGVYNSGLLYISGPSSTMIKAGVNTLKPITVAMQHESAFYGLAKAAGADEKDSTLSVGTYTETAKSAIRGMLGAASPDVIAVQDEQPTNNDTKIWLPETESTGIEVPTYAEFQALDASVVKKTDIATDTTAGIVKVIAGNGISISGSTNALIIAHATSAQMKNGVNQYNPITADGQHYAVFYGLSKAAGVDLASETVTVGTYPTTASAAIRNMLGAVGDVQVNGTSVVSNGVANIPIASTSAPGALKVGSDYCGLQLDSSGYLKVAPASSSSIKLASSSNTYCIYRPITPYVQHEAVFYGLSKVAGVDLANETVTLGTYPATSKAAIQAMLGVESGIELIETITGTTPSITGQPNTTYQCGEVSTLSITPPANGTIDVFFTSGSTATVLTVPSTVLFPTWFDPEALATDTIYEIMITSGIYGSVMTWAAT